MTGIYFSGTGNSKYALDIFLKEFHAQEHIFSIEEAAAVSSIKRHKVILFSYPVQFSNIPKIVRDFVTANAGLWKGKKVFVIATMGLFSGDGAGVLARLLKKYGAQVVGGLHVKMPDSIADEKLLKRTPANNRRLITNAEQKIKKCARAVKAGRPPQEGIGFFCQMAGLFGQRLWFSDKVKNYSDRLTIDQTACIGCGLCAANCPMHNITLLQGKAIPGSRCTMCYRCIQNCQKQAITLLGRRVVRQGTVEAYK